jgi:hypothetical protein
MIKMTPRTDAGAVILFDPLAFPKNWDLSKINQICRKGDALLYDPHSDGSYEFRVYVDEAPPTDDVMKFAFIVAQNRLLRVPSGTLWAIGQEYAYSASSVEEAKQWMPSHPKMGTRIEIPAGDYSVDAYLKKYEDYDEKIDELLSQKLSEVQKSQLESDDNRTVFGCLATLILPIAYIFAVPDKFKDIALPLIMAILVTFWLVNYLIKNKPMAEEKAKIIRDYESTLYSALLILRRVATNVPPTQGVVLDEISYQDTASSHAQIQKR